MSAQGDLVKVSDYIVVFAHVDDPEGRAAPLENEAFQQACLLQRVPEHAAGTEETGSVLHL